MINTAPSALNNVYGREKKCFDMTKLIFKSCVLLRCSGQELLARADNPGSTHGDAVLCFFVPFSFFFSVWSLFLILFSPFSLFFFILTADSAGHALGSIYILSVSPEYCFGKGFQKLLICILAKLVTREKP